MEDSSGCVEEQRRSHQILSFKLNRILQTRFVFVFYIFVPYILCLCLCSNKLFPIFLTTYKKTFPVLYPSIRPLIFCLISGFISKNKKRRAEPFLRRLFSSTFVRGYTRGGGNGTRLVSQALQWPASRVLSKLTRKLSNCLLQHRAHLEEKYGFKWRECRCVWDIENIAGKNCCQTFPPLRPCTYSY